ncbi:MULTISPECIES: histidine ammonia-lyase [unclassified Legionella]|uniref:histidine ammonia-lyase n=1 Tax=unclassified Legionella TaxID=2622702 RepID=UPI0010543648|nr:MULTISPECIES: histidine ammonia-lyase [unclassified Legionella]MDI9818471.1 histidine ammonia-lyase [Legionella sp. PL877]
MNALSFVSGKLVSTQIRQLLESSLSISLDPSCWERVSAAEQFIKSITKKNQTVYGVNTGFGLLANTMIADSDLTTLQRRILLSHAAGIGELLQDDIVKLILLFKINSLSRGFSGVRPILIETLVKFYNEGIYPCIPGKGSVGASGDLAPLAHLCLPLIGEGTARYKGEIISAIDALKIISQEPLELAPKEGLALINGTQVSAAIAYYYLLQAQNLLSASVVIGALSVDAALGCDTAFYPQIHMARGQEGQIKVAELLLHCLQGSEIRQSHADCNRVQDPYCLRCQPQVVGASLDNFRHVEAILTKEANAVTDNPLIFSEIDSIYSGGNFHAEPVAQGADLLAIALSEVGAIAERRIALLIDPNFNAGLPPFLTQNPGLNSGFMIGHVTAAALASANKSLAHPASVDSIPTSANQEDHVSMATHAAYRLKDIVENVRGILTVELLAACQGIDLRRPLKTSSSLEKLVAQVREAVPFWSQDRYFALDLEKAKPFVDCAGKDYLDFLFSDCQGKWKSQSQQKD